MSAQKKIQKPMQAFTYLVTVVAGSSEATRVWSSKKPMVVGHPMRWELTQVEGGVKASAHWTKTEHFVKDSEIAKGKGAINLVCGSEVSLRLEIRPVAKLAAAFRQEPSVGSSLKIFHCIGDWAVESVALTKKYVGKSGGKKIFSLKGNSEGSAEGVFTPDAMIEIKAMAEGITLLSSGQTLSKGETRRIRFAEISGVTLRHGGSEWRLASFSKTSDPAFLAAPIAMDSEAGLFKRTLIGALAASLLLALIAFLLPSPPPVAKVETVRILLAKKKVAHGLMTAAPTGDPHAREFSVGKHGSAKNAGKKGALAQSKKVAPAGKSAKASSKAVAHHSTSKKSAPMKTASRTSSKKSSPKKSTVVAARPAPVPHSALFKTLSSAAFQRTAKGLAAGGVSAASGSASDARRLGSAGGTGRGELGGTGGVETRSASISGFGGGGSGDGDGGPGSRGAGYGRGSNSKVSGQGRSFVSMDTGASEVEEGLTRDQVGKVIYAHRNEIRYCYDSAVLRSSELGGRMMAKFAVNASGDVSTAGVGSSTVNDRRLHECIVSRLKGMKFPKPKGGVTVAVAYPFDFKTL